MTLFDEYKEYPGDVTISPSLLWEYDLSHFDWWKSRKIVVQRVIERGWLKDFYAAFNLYEVEVETGVIISPMVMLRHVWERFTTPFSINVMKEGVVL